MPFCFGVDLLQYAKHPTAEVAVRINTSDSLATETIDYEDVNALIGVCDRIDAIVLPKFSYTRFRQLIAVIESQFEKA